MDSVTQVVLGAAIGEALLGKKIGYRAPMWGAIIGTLPDLDVLGSFFQTEFESLVTHRGLSHSLFFFVILTPMLAWIIHRIYKRKQGTFTEWAILSFWVLVTHSLLDCFTSWGTQLFYPFSNLRVAFNSIFVVDPLYTLPFLFCLIVAISLKKESIWRKKWNRAGLIISSLYLVFTLVNKGAMDRVFKHNYHEQGKSITRFSTYPTPLNNFLWYGIGESRKHFHIGVYSLFDKNPKIDFYTYPKNHDMLEMPEEDAFFTQMKWVSNDYFALSKEADTVIWEDLRFGFDSFLLDSAAQPVFKFTLLKKDGKYVDIHQGPPEIPESAPFFKALCDRIKGN